MSAKRQIFSEYISMLLDQSDRNQRELALDLGVSPSYLSKIKGEQIPPDAFLRSLANILRIKGIQEARLIALAQEARMQSHKESTIRRKSLDDGYSAPIAPSLLHRLTRELAKIRKLKEKEQEHFVNVETLLREIRSSSVPDPKRAL